MPIINVKYISGKVGSINSPYTIGDIVTVVDPGAQYSGWRQLFRKLWGTEESFHIDYEYDRDLGVCVPIGKDKFKVWKVVNAVYIPHYVYYHIRDAYGNNTVVNSGALSLLRRPRESSIGRATIEQFEPTL